MTKSKSLIIIGLLLLFALWLGGKVFLLRREQKLNLIIISIDTLRPDHMGIYGYQKNTTPNIDRFFQNAFVFTNAHTPVPKTYASFVSLFTGLSPSTTRIYNYHGRPLKNEEITLARILASSGYTNAAFVANKVFAESTDGRNTNLFAGFKSWFTLERSEVYWESVFYNHQAYEKYFAQAQSWLQENRSKRLFAWIHLYDPHGPYYPPKEYICEFNPALCGKSTDYLKYQLEKNRQALRGSGVGCSNRSALGWQTPDAKTVTLYQTLYDADINYSDTLVGKILKTIENNNLDKNSIIVLLADHGEGFDHNYYFAHGNLYESNVSIPLLIKHPYLQGSKNNLLIQNTDLLPTLLDWLGISYRREQFDGISFADFKPEREFVYGYSTYQNFYSISNNRYKYFLAKDKDCLVSGDTEELYDLEVDPQELKNIVGAKLKIKTRLKNRLFKYK